MTNRSKGCQSCPVKSLRSDVVDLTAEGRRSVRFVFLKPYSFTVPIVTDCLHGRRATAKPERKRERERHPDSPSRVVKATLAAIGSMTHAFKAGPPARPPGTGHCCGRCMDILRVSIHLQIFLSLRRLAGNSGNEEENSIDASDPIPSSCPEQLLVRSRLLWTSF